MKAYSNSTDAIFDLHKRGFTNDFQLFGNNLLWVQENLVVRVGEFAIVEYYRTKERRNAMTETAVFGIVALHHNIKGILLSHCKRLSDGATPVLIKKLNELSIASFLTGGVNSQARVDSLQMNSESSMIL